jgi:solute carrier family 25 carnitine/acylcarnitine transporter 20/29
MSIKASFAGAVGGVASVVTAHPFDLLKVKLQQEATSSVVQTIAKTYAQGGRTPLAFYRGMLLPLVGVIPIFSLCFGTFDAVLRSRTSNLHSAQSFDVLLAGAVAGAVVGVPLTPGERVKCLLQVNRNLNMIDLCKALYRGGLKSAYRGGWATMGREMIGNPCFFYTNWRLRKANGFTEQQKPPFWKVAFAGGCSGVVQWTMQLPFDTVKTRMQLESPFAMPSGRSMTFTARKYYRNQHQKLSYPEIIKDIYYNGGSGGQTTKSGRNFEDPSRRIVAGGGFVKQTSGSVLHFWRGWLPAVARAFPSSAACFLGIEGCLIVLGWYDVEDNR